MHQRKPLGGVIHTYQKYDPKNFPSPTQPPPDLVSPAFEHMMQFGDMGRLTDEELARAIKIDPSQIPGLGPSLDMLIAMLEERKRKILETYETDTVKQTAASQYHRQGKRIKPPKQHRQAFSHAFRDEQIYDLERLWYRAENSSDFARQLVFLMHTLGEKYQVEELAAKYHFTGDTEMSVEEALEIKAELEKIDELLKQLEDAKENAQIAIIDLEALSEFTEQGDLEKLEEMQRMVEDLVREAAERQGLDSDGNGGFQLTPQAYKLYQGKLLERIFNNLQAARSGRHSGEIIGEGAVEIQQTKPYEFGDSIAQMDIPQTMINALLRQGGGLPVKLDQRDIEVHRTRNTPKCATVVIMDMSGSMRYDGQYMNVKRMALALDGLIRSEYPGDYLHFIEMFTFAKPCPRGKIAALLPKQVTIHDPVVRFAVDMSQEGISEYQIPHHFTNIQHSLLMARRFLAAQDTPNRQIILITDGLPTAHFEDSTLFMLYPPDPRTEEATMREGRLCQREEITINMFLVPSWSQSEEDIRFAHRLAETTQGRVFFTAGNDLDRFVVWDYLNRKREILS